MKKEKSEDIRARKMGCGEENRGRKGREGGKYLKVRHVEELIQQHPSSPSFDAGMCVFLR